MKKKRLGRPRQNIKTNDRPSILISVRISKNEYTAFQKYLKTIGEEYMTQAARKLIQQAIA